MYQDIHESLSYSFTLLTCWHLLARVPLNAKGMICLFIEIVWDPRLSSLILWRVLMHRYQGGIFIYLFIFNNLLSNDLLIVASTLTENYRSFLGNQIFTPWVCMWRRSPETMWGETDFEEQWCVNLCVVTPLLPIVCPMDSPGFSAALYSVALFISW